MDIVLGLIVYVLAAALVVLFAVAWLATTLGLIFAALAWATKPLREYLNYRPEPRGFDVIVSTNPGVRRK